MYDAADKHRNATNEDTSSASPIRPRGIWEITAFIAVSSLQSFNNTTQYHDVLSPQKKQNKWQQQSCTNIANKNVTFSRRGVLIGPGAIQLVLMLSLAHSHAKFFVIWFIAPACQLRTRFQIG